MLYTVKIDWDIILVEKTVDNSNKLDVTFSLLIDEQVFLYLCRRSIILLKLLIISHLVPNYE